MNENPLSVCSVPGSVTGWEEGDMQRGRQMTSGPSGETNDGRKTEKFGGYNTA